MDKLYLVFPHKIARVSPYVFGVFAEHIGGVIYDGIYVGEDSSVPNTKGFRKKIIEKMREAKIPLIRWPGGCFAEVYNWRDGIGPKNQRPMRPNWWTVNDGRYESNQVGTDEFMDFCRLVGADPYFAANITATTPMDIRDWMDYCNSPAGTTTLARLREENGHKEPYGIKLWGVGNENWGGGGKMTPEFYTDNYRRYAELMRNTDPSAELISCGPSGDDYAWTRRMLEKLCVDHTNHPTMDGMSFHHYSGASDDPVNFREEDWYSILKTANRMDDIIRRNWAALLSYNEESRGGLCIDEWGAWYPDGSGPSHGYNLFEQQSTIRDGVLSALTLNTFIANAEKVKLATVAQLVNNLHCLFLSGGENCITTPTYEIFRMYQGHQGGEALETICESASPAEGLPGLSTAASIKDGKVTLTVANLSYSEDKEVSLLPLGAAIGEDVSVEMLWDCDLTAHNTFENPQRVGARKADEALKNGVLSLPHGAVAALTFPVAE